MSHIRYTSPFDVEKNISDAYNDEMTRAFSDEYIAFVDRDTIFLDPYYGFKIAEIVSEHPDCYFTCLTNRTNSRWQRWINNYDDTNNLDIHIEQTQKAWDLYEHATQDHTHSTLWSGHLMICPKNLWEPLERRGMLGVDNDIHQSAINQGARVLLMKGIYMYHYYSNYIGDGGNKQRDKSHLL